MRLKTSLIISTIALTFFGELVFVDSFLSPKSFIKDHLSGFNAEILQTQIMGNTKSDATIDAEGIVCGNRGINLPGCEFGHSKVTYDSVLTKIAPIQASGLLGLGGAIAVVTIMMAGMYYLTSMGDAAKTKKAFSMLRNTIVGLILGLLAYLLVQLVLSIDFSATALKFLIPAAHAAGVQDLIPSPPSGPNISIPVANPEQGLGGLIERGINILFYVAGPIILLIFFIMGIKLVNASGKDDEFKKAMKGLGYAALGLTLMGLAYAIARTILTFTF